MVVNSLSRRGRLSLFSFWALLVFLPLPAAGDGERRHDRPVCPALPDQFVLTAESGSQTTVTLDQIVPPSLQPMIRTDRRSLTGIWISDIDLWAPASPRACQIPKASDCPAGAVDGACPDRPDTADAYQCSSGPTWVNNTIALYELTTGSLYALNLWRVWSQETWPTTAGLRHARPPVDYGGYSFQNGVRNVNDRIYMMTAMGEFELFGTGAPGVVVQLGNKVAMEGSVHDSNVGPVIISESRTATAASLIYSPTVPNQAVWKINLRRVQRCVDDTSFEQQVFPPRRRIRIRD
jgi:hypothetical protein